jgi:dephospho-CoA kinase
MICITGLIGAGKSTVAQMLRARGQTVADADVELHFLYQNDEALRAEIVQSFGKEALRNEAGHKEINRQYLAKIVFQNSEKLKLLEGITHPVLFERMLALDAPFWEVPLLAKWPQAVEAATSIWVVTAPENVRLERLIKRGLAREDALARMEAQKKLPALPAEKCVAIGNGDDNKMPVLPGVSGLHG